MRHTFFLSVFRHFFFQSHANKYRKLTSLFFLSFSFLKSSESAMHLACAVRARTYIYLNSSLTQMPEPFALSLPYLLSFFFSARSVLPLDHHTVTSHYKL